MVIGLTGTEILLPGIEIC